MSQYDAEMADSDKPRMGRPPRTGDEASAKIVTLRLTEEEHAAWVEAAGDQSLGQWIRDRCNRSAARR